MRAFSAMPPVALTLADFLAMGAAAQFSDAEAKGAVGDTALCAGQRIIVSTCGSIACEALSSADSSIYELVLRYHGEV